jgi:4-hydroxybenzoate polyprenyltransferase
MMQGSSAAGAYQTKNRGFALLQLMRFPNLFTAVADVLAGAFIVLGTSVPLLPLLSLVLSSALMYGGGCVLNDFCDRDIDARERPSRPIPSGRISAAEALMISTAMLGLGLVAAAGSGTGSLRAAFLLILAVVAYDTLAKNGEVTGPVTMAACRALNLLLGMSIGFGDLPPVALTILLPLLSFVYVFSLTVLSRFEVEGKPSQKYLILGGWLLVITGVKLLWLAGEFSGISLFFLFLFAAFTGPGLLRALFSSGSYPVGKAVKYLVLGIPLLDAVYVSGAQSAWLALPVAFLVLPPIILARRFYVT